MADSADMEISLALRGATSADVRYPVDGGLPLVMKPARVPGGLLLHLELGV